MAIHITRLDGGDITVGAGGGDDGWGTGKFVITNVINAGEIP